MDEFFWLIDSYYEENRKLKLELLNALLRIQRLQRINDWNIKYLTEFNNEIINLRNELLLLRAVLALFDDYFQE